MVAYVFDRILAKGVRDGQIPARTQTARDWFRDTAKGAREASPRHIMKGTGESRFLNSIRGAQLGKMYMFYYDPKTKKKLKYYDTFPLIFPFDTAPGGFMGLNMHYLHYRHRAILMDALYDITNNDKFDQSTRLKRISYDLLNSAAKYKYFKPTVHRYLTSHLKSRMLEIAPAEWDIALFLPVEKFVKAGKTTVWKDSKESW